MRLFPLFLIGLVLLFIVGCEEPDTDLESINSTNKENIASQLDSNSTSFEPTQHLPPILTPLNPQLNQPSIDQQPPPILESIPSTLETSVTPKAIDPDIISESKTPVTQFSENRSTIISPTTLNKQNATSITSPLVPQTIESPPAPILKKSEFEGSMAVKILKLINRTDEVIRSYEFHQAPPPDNLARDRWYIKENRIVVKLFEQNYVKPSEYYDTIYLDARNKTAIAYCEGAQTGRCFDWNKQYNLSYTQLMIQTPYQWTKEIPYGEIQGSEMLWGRQTFKVYYEKENKAYTLWLDEYSGLTIRVQVSYSGGKTERYEFRNMAVNSVRDEQLYHHAKPNR